MAQYDLATLLGSVCIQFGTLDQFLQISITRMLSDDTQVGLIITSESSFSRLMALLKSLVYHKSSDPEILSECDALITKLALAEQRRNTCIHSNWSVVSGKVNRFMRMKHTARLKHGLRQQWEEIDAQELLDTISLINDSWNSIIAFNERLVKAGVSTPPRGIPIMKKA